MSIDVERLRALLVTAKWNAGETLGQAAEARDGLWRSVPALLDEVERLRWLDEKEAAMQAEVDRLNARMSRRIRDHARDVRALGDAQCALGDIATALGLDSDHDDWDAADLAGMVEQLRADLAIVRMSKDAARAHVERVGQKHIATLDELDAARVEVEQLRAEANRGPAAQQALLEQMRRELFDAGGLRSRLEADCAKAEAKVRSLQTRLDRLRRAHTRVAYDTQVAYEAWRVGDQRALDAAMESIESAMAAAVAAQAQEDDR